jgi:hypothetical protein
MGESLQSADKVIHWGREGRLIAICSAATHWTDASWQEFLEGSVAMEARHDGPAHVTLCYFPVGNPTAGQRRMSAETTKKSRFANRVALLSDSAVTRAAFTAIQWVLGRQTEHKAFRPAEVLPALQWLAESVPFDVPAAEQRTRDMVRATHAAVGTPPPF